jgi:hypothetical protein
MRRTIIAVCVNTPTKIAKASSGILATIAAGKKIQTDQYKN